MDACLCAGRRPVHSKCCDWPWLRRDWRRRKPVLSRLINETSEPLDIRDRAQFTAQDPIFRAAQVGPSWRASTLERRIRTRDEVNSNLVRRSASSRPSPDRALANGSLPFFRLRPGHSVANLSQQRIKRLAVRRRIYNLIRARRVEDQVRTRGGSWNPTGRRQFRPGIFVFPFLHCRVEMYICKCRRVHIK